MKTEWGGNSKEYVQGMIAIAFIGVPILWATNVMSGGWALVAMLIILGIGGANADR